MAGTRSYIGKNRNTLKEGEAPPDANIVYPMAFLVEKDSRRDREAALPFGGSISGRRSGWRTPRRA